MPQRCVCGHIWRPEQVTCPSCGALRRASLAKKGVDTDPGPARTGDLATTANLPELPVSPTSAANGSTSEQPSFSREETSALASAIMNTSPLGSDRQPSSPRLLSVVRKIEERRRSEQRRRDRPLGISQRSGQGGVPVEQSWYRQPAPIIYLHPPLLAANSSPVLFADNFRTDRYNWPDDGQRYYFKKNEYHIHNSGSDDLLIALNEEESFPDFSFETELHWLGSDREAGFGISFRAQDDENFYAFLTCAAGAYCLTKFEKGEWELLQPWTNHEAIEPRLDRNVLRVICKGEHLTLYANDQLLTSVTDSTYPAGYIGLIVAPGRVHVAYSYIIVQLVVPQVP